MPPLNKVLDNERKLTFYLVGRYIYCQYHADDDILQMSTGRKVIAADFKAKLYSKAEVAYMRRLTDLVDIYAKKKKQAYQPAECEEIRQLIAENLQRNVRHKIKPVVKPSSGSLHGYMSAYLQDVKIGKILNRGKKYSESWVEAVVTVLNKIEHMPIGKMDVNNITAADLRAYAATLTQQGYALNTVATYLDPIQNLLNAGRLQGKHQAPKIEAKAYGVGREENDYAVYLTTEQIHQLLELPYTGKHGRWRDAFVLGCFIGMRYSDLSRIGPKNRNGDMLNINTQKTGTPVWAPMNETAKLLFDRCNGDFKLPPHRSTFSNFAQRLCKLAGETFGADSKFNNQVLFSRTEGGVKVEKWVKECELVGSHTCRRSFATNAYKAGVPMLSIMKITSHKSTISFQKYIRLTAQEHAELIAQHPHFK